MVKRRYASEERLRAALAYLTRVLDVATRALPSDDGGDAVRLGIEDEATGEIAAALGPGLAEVLADPAGSGAAWDAAVTAALMLAVTRMLERAAVAGVAQAQLELGSVSVDWALVNRDAREWARNYAGELVRGLNATTRDVLRQEIATWIESGEPLAALGSRLAPTFGEMRGRVIAETEVTRAFAQGQLRAFERGGVERWRWNTANDERVCDVCQPRDGQVYEVGRGEEPPAHVRCRCWISAVTT